MGNETSKKLSITSLEFIFGIVTLTCTCFGVVWGIYSHYESAIVEQKEAVLVRANDVRQERLDLAREELVWTRTQMARADSVAQSIIDSLTTALNEQIAREQRLQASIESLPPAVRSSPQVQRVFVESRRAAEKTSQAVARLDQVKAARRDLSKIQLDDPKTDAIIQRLLKVP